jgi:hypothetical protein
MSSTVARRSTVASGLVLMLIVDAVDEGVQHQCRSEGNPKALL